MAASTSAPASADAAAAAGTSRRRSRRNVNTVPLLAPSVVVLLLWMIVPLALTLWFSFQRYNLVVPSIRASPGSRTTSTC